MKPLRFRGSHSAFIIPASEFRLAFTLVEVTISVALAVVLMLGISQAFRVVGETVGTGQALATVQRDARAAQAVMANDFLTAVTDQAPFMLLDSSQVFAFRNQADLLGSKTQMPNYFDPTGSGTESAQPANPYNYRSHRIDALTFFGRGSFARQTGADATATNGQSPFVSNMGEVEAMLWYGHLNLADNNGLFTTASATSNNTPGAGTTTLGSSTYYSSVNPNNYFASSWILGRQQTLMQERTTLGNNNQTLYSVPGATTGTPVKEIVDQSTYYNGQGTPQYAYMPQASPPLSPLAYNSVAYQSTGTATALTLASQSNANATMLSSRIDLAATSIVGFRSILSPYITAGMPPFWWTLMPGGTNNLRYQAQPFFLTKPPTPESMAYQAPIFVRGCTQFTVEFAGDYLNQTTLTQATGLPPVTLANQGITDAYYHTDGTVGTTDGQIDYIITGTAPNFNRSIRWYGLPRSTTNNSTINLTNGDVVPLRDTLTFAKTSNMLVTNSSSVTVPVLTQAPFETNPIITTSTNYAPLTALTPYICAWGPTDRKPKMIRITMTLDDPGGRLGDGQTYEYIYTLP